MNYEIDKYWLWMTCIDKMWHEKAKKVLKVFDNPRTLYMASMKELEKSGIFSEEEIYNIVDSREKTSLEDRWSNLEKKGIKLATVDNSQYLQKLQVYDENPLWLYYKGKLPSIDKKLVGIVGARACSQYGKSMAEALAEELSSYSVGTVSGLAKGIDGAAHKGSLKGGGETYAVMGCGVDICYPRENIDIYMRILENGGIISEYPPGTNPIAYQFPARNRIISMMSDTIAVMEARRKSGSLITTDYALKYGKEVFALPGRVSDALSEGCNDLIKSGASVLTDCTDMVFSTGIYIEEINMSKNKKINIVLEKENDLVYSCLDLLPQNIEGIIQKTGLTAPKVYEIMMQLMMKGLVIEPVRNHYAKRM